MKILLNVSSGEMEYDMHRCVLIGVNYLKLNIVVPIPRNAGSIEGLSRFLAASVGRWVVSCFESFLFNQLAISTDCCSDTNKSSVSPFPYEICEMCYLATGTEVEVSAHKQTTLPDMCRLLCFAQVAAEKGYASKFNFT